jgi:hypothetical protein
MSSSNSDGDYNPMADDDATALEDPVPSSSSSGKRKATQPNDGTDVSGRAGCSDGGSGSSIKKKARPSKMAIIDSDEDDTMDGDGVGGGGGGGTGSGAVGAAGAGGAAGACGVAGDAGEEEEVGNHRKKLKRDKLGRLLLNVGFTGARAGDVLEGAQDDTAGVVMKVVSGVVHAPLKVRRLVDGASDLREEFVAAVMRQQGTLFFLLTSALIPSRGGGWRGTCVDIVSTIVLLPLATNSGYWFFSSPC